jgi:hypothetical protein
VVYPTWGSGYVSNGKFYKKINNAYYKVNPATLIKTHIPFDYLWQFLNYPVTNQEFYDGKTQPNKAKPYFDFDDSIRIYENQSRIQQLTASFDRIKNNGVKNSLIFDRLNHIKLEIDYENNLIENKKIETENERQNNIVNQYNAAIVDYNNGINNFNRFIDYRNKHFLPAKPDIDIQKMLDEADNNLQEAERKINEIVNPDKNIAANMLQLSSTIAEANTQVKEQQDWLKIYFSKGKMARKSMFTQYTWFGIPLN